jgi:cell division septum initiation protein DivIVA
MSTNPMDPVFGSTSFPRGDGLSENGNSPGYAPQDATVELANSELGAIAGAIEELQGRLAQAHDQLNQVAVVQTTEYEIGRLFVEAQRFSEASLSKLEMQIQEILVEAEAKAAEILREATEDAGEIRRQAQQSSFIPGHTAQELQSAIVGFASINSELVKELTALNDMLTPASEPRHDPMSYSSDATNPR